MTIAEERLHAYLAVNSEVCDLFLALLGEDVVMENSLDRIGEKVSADYQRGKVAMIRRYQALAKNAVLKRSDTKE